MFILIIRLPKTVFSPYTDINTNIIFFYNNVLQIIHDFIDWICHKIKKILKTNPMVSKHLDPIRQLWNNRNEIIEILFINQNNSVSSDYWRIRL